MIAFLVLATGFAVSAAVFHLACHFGGYAPGFDAATVKRFGAIVSTLLFALCGPVMVWREKAHSVPGLAFQATLFCIWAGSLGLVAAETGRLVLAI